MTIQKNHENIINEFSNLLDWDEKYKYIIQLGRKMEPYPEGFKTDKFKIEGCQSQVWLYAKSENGKIYFYADSDALIVRGLSAILVRAYSGFSPEQILSVKPDFIKEIGIDNQLSPTRKNGLMSMLKQIYDYAKVFKIINKQ
ncbi:MAG: SufE family protein [Ignavibacteriales bacterium]|nr:SufE family protein [Ignavibacteriales bacterium]